MKIFNVTVATIFLLIGSLQTTALADNKEVVQTFYDFLSDPSSKEQADAFSQATAENWESIGDYSGTNKKRDEFIGQVSGFFATLIPDLNWAVQDMIEEDGKVVVRSRATGTPNGPLFGVDGNGKSFDILTIDIHTIADGKIVSTFHVEDWAGALQQLSSK